MAELPGEPGLIPPPQNPRRQGRSGLCHGLPPSVESGLRQQQGSRGIRSWCLSLLCSRVRTAMERRDRGRPPDCCPCGKGGSQSSGPAKPVQAVWPVGSGGCFAAQAW